MGRRPGCIPGAGARTAVRQPRNTVERAAFSRRRTPLRPWATPSTGSHPAPPALRPGSAPAPPAQRVYRRSSLPDDPPRGPSIGGSAFRGVRAARHQGPTRQLARSASRRSRDHDERLPGQHAGPGEMGDPRVRVYTPPELNGRSVTWVTPTFFFGAPRPAQLRSRPASAAQEGDRESGFRRCPSTAQRREAGFP